MTDTLNFKIYDPIADIIASGSSGGIPLPNSIPGASIINNSITNTQLALGAAAANINAGPAGSINSAQITGGPFLPLAGGTVTNDIFLATAPSGPTALTNKTYVDSKTTTPNSIPGTSIANGSITSNQLAPGAPSTLKGTNQVGVLNDITFGNGLAMPANVLTIDMATIQKADDNNFGAVKFDATGDLKHTAAASGIAKIKQPALPVQSAVFNAAFNALGDFIISPPARSGTFGLPNNTPLIVSNVQIMVAEVGPNRGLQFAVVNAAGGGTGTNSNGIGFSSSTVVSNTHNSIALSTSFVSLSNPPWTNKDVEEWFIYVNDGIDNAFYRVTAYMFTPNSAVTIERLSTQ